MDIYHVGPDLLSDDYDLKEIYKDEANILWVVYWYQDGGYDGSGELVYMTKDKAMYVHNLGHCSCYGPMEGESVLTTVEELLREKEDIWDKDCKEAVKSKVRELVSNDPPGLFDEQFNFLAKIE